MVLIIINCQMCQIRKIVDNRGHFVATLIQMYMHFIHGLLNLIQSLMNINAIFKLMTYLPISRCIYKVQHSFQF